MQFFVDRDTVRMLLSQKEAAQLSLCPQPDCNDPKVCENLSRLIRRAAACSGRCIPKGEFSVSVCSQEQGMEITLTRLGAEQGQRQVWRFWESEQMIQGCFCLFCLLFYCLSLNLPSTWEKKAECILLEYAQKAKHPLLAQGVLAERAVCLVQKKAVERIAESFGRSG